MFSLSMFDASSLAGEVCSLVDTTEAHMLELNVDEVDFGS